MLRFKKAFHLTLLLALSSLVKIHCPHINLTLLRDESSSPNFCDIKFINANSKILIFQSFVHVSTAYTNWFLNEAKEEIYPTEFDPNDIITLCKSLPNSLIDKVSKIGLKHCFIKNNIFLFRSLQFFLESMSTRTHLPNH